MKASGGKKRARSVVAGNPSPPLASPHFTFDALCLPYATPEHKFHPTRRWRLDWAWVPNKIALEIDGGIWTYGRHTRAAGFLKDMEKMNEAALLGWLVIHVTPEEFKDGRAAALIDRAFGVRS